MHLASCAVLFIRPDCSTLSCVFQIQQSLRGVGRAARYLPISHDVRLHLLAHLGGFISLMALLHAGMSFDCLRKPAVEANAGPCSLAGDQAGLSTKFG